MISIVFAGWGTTESVTKKSTWKIPHIICPWRRSAVDFLLLNCINLRQVLVLIFVLMYVCSCVISNWSTLWKKLREKFLNYSFSDIIRWKVFENVFLFLFKYPQTVEPEDLAPFQKNFLSDLLCAISGFELFAFHDFRGTMHWILYSNFKCSIFLAFFSTSGALVIITV